VDFIEEASPGFVVLRDDCLAVVAAVLFDEGESVINGVDHPDAGTEGEAFLIPFPWSGFSGGKTFDAAHFLECTAVANNFDAPGPQLSEPGQEVLGDFRVYL